MIIILCRNKRTTVKPDRKRSFKGTLDYNEYIHSTYYQVTKRPYAFVLRDTGRCGEYLTYRALRHYEQQGARFLFNLYVPKGNGETTEVDVVMINPKGLFVFESKNFSGWIFGREDSEHWCQVLKGGERNYFYNPIAQNRTHLYYLEKFLGKPIPMHSVIVFSERCTLKDIEAKTSKIKVVNRYNLNYAVTEISRHFPDALSKDEIVEIYNALFMLGQVDQAAKERHNEDIYKQQGSAPSEAAPETRPAGSETIVDSTEQMGEGPNI